MSETERRGAHPVAGGSDEDEVRRLLALAGPRPQLDAAELAAVRDAARHAWRERYPAPRAARRLWWAGLAAAAALALYLGTRWWPAAAPAPVAAGRVEAVRGAVRWSAAGAPGAPLPASAAGRPLPPGARLVTGGGDDAGRVALRLAGGASLRLDTATSLRLVSATLVELDSGAVYVDSGSSPAAAVAVRTAAGVFREIGTRFEVRVVPAGRDGGQRSSPAGTAGVVHRVRVRAGSVALESGGRRVVATAGEELAAGAGGLVRRRVAAWDDGWDWVLASAPVPAIEGTTARAFLDWFARESGRRLVLDGGAAPVAAATVLHGSVSHLTPQQALAAVLASCGLAQEQPRGGELVVRVAAGEAGN